MVHVIRLALVFIFIVCTLPTESYAQDLTYSYPLTLPKYSKDVKTVEFRTIKYPNFDSSTISPDLTISGKPRKITYLEDGRILKIINYETRSESTFEFDTKRNISARTYTNSARATKYNFKLSPRELKLEAFRDSSLVETNYFDENFNVIRNYVGSKGPDSRERKQFYTNGQLIRIEHHFGDTLSNFEIFRHVDEIPDLEKIDVEPLSRITYVKGNSVRKDYYTIFPGKIEFLYHIIEFYDDQENLIKKYQIGTEKDRNNCTVEEYLIQR